MTETRKHGAQMMATDKKMPCNSQFHRSFTFSYATTTIEQRLCIWHLNKTRRNQQMKTQRSVTAASR